MRTLLAAVAAAALAVGSAQVTLAVTTASSIGTSPPELASFGWEMWNYVGAVPHLADPVFQKLASGLAPAVVRVGGITADWVQYVLPGDEHLLEPGWDERMRAQSAAPMTQRRLGGFWPSAPEPLPLSNFTALLNFMSAANLSLIFDLNELFGRNCNTTNPKNGQPDWCVGAWDQSNVRAFLQYIHDNSIFNGKPLVGFELGNELVSHLDPAANIVDILSLHAIIADIWADVPAAQRPPLWAPSTDTCTDPSTGAIMNAMAGKVEGFSYHAYPFGGGASCNLTAVLTNATRLRTGILAGSASSQCIAMWNAGPRAAGLALAVTESSSSWDWDLPAPAQNSQLHGAYTLAALGQYALKGETILCRWAFLESSPFGTMRLDSSHAGGYSVAADYYLLVVHKRAVGSRVLAVSGDDGSAVIAFASCAPALDGSVTIMAVNTGATLASVELVDGGSGSQIQPFPRDEWVFTPVGGNYSRTTSSLNGGPALDTGADGSLPPLEPRRVTTGGITLPPYSQAFITILKAGAAACV